MVATPRFRSTSAPIRSSSIPTLGKRSLSIHPRSGRLEQINWTFRALLTRFNSWRSSARTFGTHEAWTQQGVGEALNRHLGELENFGRNAFSLLGEQSTSLQTLEALGTRVEDLSLATQIQITDVQAHGSSGSRITNGEFTISVAIHLRRHRKLDLAKPAGLPALAVVVAKPRDESCVAAALLVLRQRRLA